jgi:hypothetical protein
MEQKMNSNEMTKDQQQLIYSLMIEMSRKFETSPSLGLAFLNAARLDFNPLFTRIGKPTMKLNSKQASRLIDMLRSAVTPDSIMEAIAGDEKLLNLFGAKANRFWSWMFSADGITGMDEKDAIAKAMDYRNN